MDKQKKTLLILAVLLVAALLGLLGAKKLADKKDKADAIDSAEESIQVYSVDADDVTRVSYYNNGAQVTLTKSDDGWQDAEGVILDDDKVKTMLSYLTTIKASDVIEDTDDISQYGFSSATNEVTITTKDSETTFTIGMQNAITDKYYLMVDYDESKVYVIDSSMLTACGYSTSDLVPDESSAESQSTDDISESTETTEAE